MVDTVGEGSSLGAGHASPPLDCGIYKRNCLIKGLHLGTLEQTM